MTDKKLCVDCKWFRREFLMPNHLGKCANPILLWDRFVDGGHCGYASNNRNYNCGEEGKYWEPKK